MCCSKGVSKTILMIFNGLFLLVGGATLGLGIFVLYDKSQITGILSRIPSSISTPVQEVINQTSLLEGSAYAMIAAGGVIFIIAGVGFFGACKEKPILLYIYAIIVFLIFGAEVAAGVLGYLYRDRLQIYFRDFLNDTIVEYYNSGTFGTSGTTVIIENVEPVSAAWDFTMVYFQCCGNYNYTDFTNYAKNWNNLVNYTSSDGTNRTIAAEVPITCCKTSSTSVFPTNIQFEDLEGCLQTANSTTTNHENCYDKLYTLFTQYAYICLGVGIGVVVIEILGFLAACCLIRSIKKEKENDKA